MEDVKKFLKNYKFTNFEDEKKDIISQYPIYIQQNIQRDAYYLF